MSKPKFYNQTKTRIKKPKPRFRSSRDYDFLQYVRIVMKWAMKNYDLSRPDIELILYLYPMGAFSIREFNRFHKTMRMYHFKTLDRFIEDGWIVMWRPKKGKESALYTLTNKAKTMCSKMHKYCTGELSIPTNPRVNVLAGNTGVRMDGYYMEIIKKMNRDRGTKEDLD
ncbi:MAG: winged helix-turn-helix transcriptional regulator [Pseudoalteromonas sp.]|uniref:MarR family winged helix-turn-helix transcriptional regulator n=1 Tax=Pseudoalteromonas sp. TaxID=53249 RepID=UPI001DF03F0B|nr:MarR family winged helix-turn-helix transcriptional regulator [Pseudoalteromonas sp.]NRA77252.1 winged helix-turn-helix transcriptional regulator [Pseudoalteromonas sp.]